MRRFGLHFPPAIPALALMATATLATTACNSPSGGAAAGGGSTFVFDSTASPVQPTGVSPPDFGCSEQQVSLSARFNVITSGNFTVPDSGGASSMGGGLEAGGDVTAWNLSVGTALPNDPSQADLIADGNVDLENGSVPHGTIEYGGTLTLNATPVAGSPAPGSPSAAQADLISALQVSTTMASLPPNAQALSAPGGIASSLTFLSLGNGPNLFQIEASELSGTQALSIQGSPSTFVLINVLGQSVELRNLTVSLSGGVTPNHVLFNYPQATTLSLAGVAFQGTLLAPLAAVSISSGMIQGQLVAASVTGNGNFDMNPYVGCLPVPPGSVTPAPAPHLQAER